MGMALGTLARFSPGGCWQRVRSQLCAGDLGLPTWKERPGSDLGGGEEHPMGKGFVLATV